MVQGMDNNFSSDEIRKALERLQETFEVVQDRYREMRRERKMLLERLEQMENERITIAADAASYRQQTEQGQASITELEEKVAIAEEKNAALESELTTARNELDSVQQEAEVIRADRSELREKQLQLIGKLDSATRDASMARTRAVELESTREQADELKKKLEELRETFDTEKKRYTDRLNGLEERVANAEQQRVEAEGASRTLLAERDQARETVESLLIRIKQLEEGDDEEKSEYSSQIDELRGDLAEALDMAARKEAETIEAQRTVDELQETVNEYSKKLESLQANGQSSSAEIIALFDDDRDEIVSQIEMAIELIDKHLQEDMEGSPGEISE